MSLFTDVPLTDEQPMSMPAYQYLNSSSRPSLIRRRQLIDEWFERFPEEAKAKLKGAFQTKIDNQHISAFFELLVHEILVQQGMAVQVSDLDQHNKLPDFLVTRQDGYRFFVEVCHVADSSELSAGTQQRLNIFHDYVNASLHSSDFLLSLRVHSAGPRDLPRNSIVANLDHWLQTLSYEDLVSEFETTGKSARPTWQYVRDGWKLEIQTCPKKKLRRSSDHKIVGIWGNTKSRDVDADIRLAEAIIKKTNYYGDLDLPFVIAANSNSFFSDIETTAWALFGRPAYLMRRSGENFLRIESRANGAWLRSNQYWINNKCSALLHVCGVSPLNTFGARACMFYHPQPNFETESILPGLSQCRVEDGGLEYPDREGCSKLGDVLIDTAEVERNEDHDD